MFRSNIENSPLILFTLMKAGGLNLCIDGGGRPPPSKKALENMYRVEMHVHSSIFQGQLIEEKIISITSIV